MLVLKWMSNMIMKLVSQAPVQTGAACLKQQMQNLLLKIGMWDIGRGDKDERGELDGKLSDFTR
jgi:hypothetical protein